MTTDEASRYHLYEMARAVLDDAAADTLMTALPRDPDRFATKDDVAALGTHLDAKIDVLRADVATIEANLRGEMHALNSSLLRTLFFGMIASNATLVGLVVAAVRLG